MNKAYLVARREFVENLRTKAFWIGILAFPVILSLSIFVPQMLEKTKQARAFSVIDHSGWLLDAVMERSSTPDLNKVLLLARNRARDAKPLDTLPKVLQDMAPELAKLSDEQVEMMARGYAMMARPTPEVVAALESMPEGIVEKIKSTLEEVRTWWKNLPAGEAKDLAPGVDRSKFELKQFAELGSDTEAELKARVSKGELFAYFVVPADPVQGDVPAKYFSNNLTDDDLKQWFTNLASEEIKQRRIIAENIDATKIRRILEPLRVVAMQSGAKAGEEKKVDKKSEISQWVPVVFVYLLWVSIFTIGQMLLTNTIEEKSNRIIEVLLSSVSPLDLMTGKIFGIAATGLTVIISWVVFFFLALKFGPALFGKSPPFDLSFILSDPGFLLGFIGYFLVGYFLYAALFVGIGSVCNSLKEAQNLMMPMTVVLLVPLFAMMPIVKDPNGSLAKFLSYVPVFTPFVMMNRAAAPPTVFEYVTTGILLVITTILLFFAAAKVFRIGILMTGKPPKFSEIFQWLRAPVGRVPDQKSST